MPILESMKSTKPEIRVMKINNFWTNTVLVLISVSLTVVFALFAIEVYLRIQFGIESKHDLTDMVVFHEERGWKLKSGNYRNFEPGAMTLSNIAINSLGVRGKEVPPKADPGRERVTLVGDSFMFAAALDARDAIADRVQTAVGDQYEIVNLAIPGYGTGQEILFLQDLQKNGYDWGSRVILVFFTNDIQDNLGLDYGTLSRLSYRPAISVGADGSLVIDRPMKPDTPKNASVAEENKYLFDDFLMNRARLVAARFPIFVKILGSVTGRVSLPRDPGIITGWYADGWEARWKVTSDLINYMNNMVRTEVGREFDIVFIPSPFQVENVFNEIVESNASHNKIYRTFLDDIDRPQRMLMNLCKEKKIRCIDVTDKLRMASKNQPTYFLQEGHLNAYGVSVIYDVFDALIRNSGSK